MDDDYLRRMLAPFRRERAYSFLLWGLQGLIAMPLLAAVYLLLVNVLFPVPVPWPAEWLPVVGNAIVVAAWIGIGMRGVWVFRRRRLAGFAYRAALKTVLAMAWRDMPYLNPYPPS